MRGRMSLESGENPRFGGPQPERLVAYRHMVDDHCAWSPARVNLRGSSMLLSNASRVTFMQGYPNKGSAMRLALALCPCHGGPRRVRLAQYQVSPGPTNPDGDPDERGTCHPGAS